LPDDILSSQKSQFWFIFVILGIEAMALFLILVLVSPFGIFYLQFGIILVYIFPLWYIATRKIWNPGRREAREKTYFLK
jgi:hypothetical protein